LGSEDTLSSLALPIPYQRLKIRLGRAPPPQSLWKERFRQTTSNRRRRRKISFKRSLAVAGIRRKNSNSPPSPPNSVSAFVDRTVEVGVLQKLHGEEISRLVCLLGIAQKKISIARYLTINGAKGRASVLF